MPDFDVIVVGAGNAALAAANSAREEGADRVVVLEKAPEPERGGNTYFSGGLLRIAFGAPRALEPLLPDVEARLPGFFDNVEPYTEDDFLSDLKRVTADRRTRRSPASSSATPTRPSGGCTTRAASRWRRRSPSPASGWATG